jgi:hypothetical protein
LSIQPESIIHKAKSSKTSHKKNKNKEMLDSESSSSREYGTMTNNLESISIIKKDSYCHAKNEEDIGVMTFKTNKSMRNSEVNTIHAPEVGITCQMRDNVITNDSECDANQFEQNRGVNTLLLQKVNQESSTNSVIS